MTDPQVPSDEGEAGRAVLDPGLAGAHDEELGAGADPDQGTQNIRE